MEEKYLATGCSPYQFHHSGLRRGGLRPLATFTDTAFARKSRSSDVLCTTVWLWAEVSRFPGHFTPLVREFPANFPKTCVQYVH